MALPDLDKSNVGFIAFWNALDNGAGSIDPTDVESYLDTSEAFSNGVQGEKKISFSEKPDSRTVRCRAKNDGWLIAWLDRTRQFNQEQNSKGPFDIIDDWTNRSSNTAFPSNKLEDVVNGMYNALSNSGTANYNTSDVSLFQYTNEDATTLRHGSVQDFGGGQSFDVSITQSATAKEAFVAGNVPPNPNGSNSPMLYEFGSTTINLGVGVNTYDAVGNGNFGPSNTATISENEFNANALLTFTVVF